MKTLIYFPSTFFGFIGRGYGGRKKSVCRCGYYVAMKQGGSTSVLPARANNKLLKVSEVMGRPLTFGNKMNNIWQIVNKYGKEISKRKKGRGVRGYGIQGYGVRGYGNRLKKESLEAKLFMANLRAMRRKKKKDNLKIIKKIMKYYFYVPSTLNTFIGRGYCKGRRKKRGCVVSVGYGGELEIEPVSEEAVEEVIPEKKAEAEKKEGACTYRK